MSFLNSGFFYFPSPLFHFPSARTRAVTGWRGCLVAAALLLAAVSGLQGQSEERGELRGRIIAAESGDPLPGASVTVEGTKLGGIADQKGVYSVRGVPAGTYTITVRSLGYTEQQIVDVAVSSGVTVLDVILQDSIEEGESLVVTAKAGTGTEAGLLSIRRKAGTVNDGISRAEIRRSPDATSGDAIARVTGMSVVGGKFISVRGTNERYNTTQVNGVELPSTEPDKKSFSFDLFPANLLENMIVSKTFTPDLPGNFTGGFVQLNTIDFPDTRTLRLSVSASYDPATTFDPMHTGARGGNDWLGIDDGIRSLPADFPSTTIFRDSLEPEAQYELARRFSNTWAPVSLDAPLNSSFLLSYGDRFHVIGNDLGVVAALSYRNSYQRQEILRRDESVFDYAGEENLYSVLWGGLFNVSYKLSDMHSISLRNIYNRTAEDRFTALEGDDLHNFQQRRLTGSSYLERSFYSGQMGGEHLFPKLGNLRFQWKGSGSIGVRDEPDYRRVTYIRGDSSEPYRLGLFDAATWKNVGRTFNHLDEEVFGFNGDLTMPIGESKLKAGALVENKTRTFAQRAFAYGSKNSGWKFTTAAIDTVFLPEHIAPDRIFFVEQTVPSMAYNAHSNLNAAYLMADLSFKFLGADLRTILGGRLEQMRLTMASASNADNSPVNADYDQTDLLPALTVIYAASSALNVRAAYSRTVTRPEFREYAPFSFYDFATGQDIYGNPNLRRALSTNYDLRVEYFPGPGEVAAVSFFHKNIEDAIEQVALSGIAFTNPQLTWNNADEARNTGIELELRKSFGFIHESLSPFSFSANYTWLESESVVKGDSLRSAKKGRLQGQSPYVINAGLSYDNTTLGTSVTLLFNRFGPRILEVTNRDPNSTEPSARPDFIEQPRSQLDLSIAQTFLTRFEARLTLKNLLGEDVVFTQAGVPSRVNYRSAGGSLSISWKL